MWPCLGRAGYRKIEAGPRNAGAASNGSDIVLELRMLAASHQQRALPFCYPA